MKATKVLGIVLGVLLVAGLFAGAAAAVAATNDVSLGDVEVYKLYKSNSTQFTGINLGTEDTWTGDSGSVTFLNEDGTADLYYIAGENIVPGKYYRYIGETNYFINVKYPTATVTGYILDKQKVKIAQLIGNTVDTGKGIMFNNYDELAFTNPDGKLTSKDLTQFGAEGDNTSGFTIKGLDLGEWTVQAVFEAGYTGNATADVFSKLAPRFMYGEEYHFTVVKENTDASISTVNTEITQGGYATVVIEAPKGFWYVTVDENGMVPADQPGVDLTSRSGYAKVEVPVSGIASLAVKAVKTSNIKVTLYEEENGSPKTTSEDSLTIKVKAGAITAEAEFASVYIGNDVDISGTNDLGGNLYFYIKGTNYPFTYIKDITANGKVWTETLKTAVLAEIYNKRPDAGTYTIYVASLAAEVTDPRDITSVDMLDKEDKVQAYSTVSLALKQPFLNIVEAPEVVTHGDKLVVKGTAEGKPDYVQYYVFGTNKFFSAKEPVESDGTFEISKKVLEADDDSAVSGDLKLAAGQYFLVIQHKMYDGKFNIGPVLVDSTDVKKGYNIMLNENGEYNDPVDNTTYVGKVIFNTNERQSANAAQALCDALDSQNIDDMYVKASFIVAGKTSYIDAIPTKITKGQVLTVSGTTTGHKNDVVTVELLSTAFAAMPKEVVGSASFVALSTKIDETGVWSITFDTSALDADEYTCSVAVGDLNAETSKITIVEGSTPVTPTQTTPVTPTAKPTAQPTATPATPGFGALAALAGLGAVAVLLLRRQ